MTTTIAQQVSHLVETMAAQPPNEVMGVFGREQAEFAAGGSPAGVIGLGARMPDAELIDTHGATTTLYEALGDRVAVLVFHRGAYVEVRPVGGFGSCPTFDSSSDVSIRLQATYEATMPALYFGADPLPDWVAICRRVAEQRDLL
jgi:hypothetical protein